MLCGDTELNDMVKKVILGSFVSEFVDAKSDATLIKVSLIHLSYQPSLTGYNLCRLLQCSTTKAQGILYTTLLFCFSSLHQRHDRAFDKHPPKNMTFILVS